MPKASAQQKLIKIAHSPDSDDAFMFYAIKEGKIDLRGYQFEIDSAEIAVLNEAALRRVGAYRDSSNDYSIIAVSFHAYAYLAEQWQILRAGSSLGGENYGPRVVSKPAAQFSNGTAKIAVPGKLTSAYLCLELYRQNLPESLKDFEPYFCSFDEVFALLEAGTVDASLLIHESQLKYEEHRLELIVDLGAWWYKRTNGLAMPLGCNVIDRSLGGELIAEISSILHESIAYGFEHFEETLEYARQFSQNGLDDAKAKEYISMYVNEKTLSLKDEDINSIKLMLGEAHRAGLLRIEAMPPVDPV